MKYQNTDTERRLVTIKRMRVWVEPKEVVNLAPSDIRFLGINGIYLKPVDINTPLGVPGENDPEPKPAPPPLPETTLPKQIVININPNVTEPPEVTAKRVAKAAANKIKNAVKNVIKKSPEKKEDPKPVSTKEDRATQKNLKAELKSLLEDMNKGAVIEFSETYLKIDAKWKNKKDDIIKKALAAARKEGYENIIKKAKK